jgi:hypothetical protein
MRNSSCPPHCEFQIGSSLNRTEMSCQFNLEQADKGTWRRNTILRSEDLVWTLPNKGLETGEGGA